MSSEIKKKLEEEIQTLEKELRELQRAHFSLRMQKATQQLQNTSQIRNARRDVARVRTIMAQKANAK